MKNENLIFPAISKQKQQSIYGANGSGDSSVVDLPGFELTFSGSGSGDYGDIYGDLGDTFGDDNGGYDGGYDGGSDSSDNNQDPGHPAGVDPNGDPSAIVQTLDLTVRWIQDGNKYTGVTVTDVFKIQNNSIGFGSETFTGNANIGGINVGYYVAALYNNGDAMDQNNELDFVEEPDFRQDGSVWLTIYDSSSMNSGKAARAILKYESGDDYRHFWGN